MKQYQHSNFHINVNTHCLIFKVQVWKKDPISILIKQLTSSDIAITVHNVTGFDIQMIILQMKINSTMSNMTYLSQVVRNHIDTFQQHSYRLGRILGTPISYKQLYHISVYNLTEFKIWKKTPSKRYKHWQKITLLHGNSVPHLNAKK